MSKRGGACECPRVGAFFKLMTSRGQCPRGGCAWCSTHPSSDPPPPTWLAGYGPAYMDMFVFSLLTWFTTLVYFAGCLCMYKSGVALKHHMAVFSCCLIIWSGAYMADEPHPSQPPPPACGPINTSYRLKAKARARESRPYAGSSNHKPIVGIRFCP